MRGCAIRKPLLSAPPLRGALPFASHRYKVRDRFTTEVSYCMRPDNSLQILSPIIRAVGQLDDPSFWGVLLQSLVWSALCFLAVYAAAIWALHHLLDVHGWLGWVADIAGSIGAALLAFWLFLPVAAGIGTFYIERVALAVERRFYPSLARAESAPVLDQVWDGIAVALKVLALSIAALVIALMVPGVGFILGWMIAAYAIGRGLFVAVAMRRMPRVVAESLYRESRLVVLTQGAILALAAYIPVLNLLIPMVGTAAMVHIVDTALTTSQRSR